MAKSRFVRSLRTDQTSPMPPSAISRWRRYFLETRSPDFTRRIFGPKRGDGPKSRCMPPSSISSAIALVGLCSLAALETGGCSNSSKSLASVTRSGLPLIAALLREPVSRVRLFNVSNAGAAQQSRSAESAPPGSHDVGLEAVPGLEPHCGRYEFKPDGGLVVWDALATRLSAERAATTLSKQDPSLHWTSERDGSLVASRQYVGRNQQIAIRKRNNVRLPDNCGRSLPDGTQSVVVVAQTM